MYSFGRNSNQLNNSSNSVFSLKNWNHRSPHKVPVTLLFIVAKGGKQVKSPQQTTEWIKMYSPHNNIYFSHKKNKVLLNHTATRRNLQNMSAETVALACKPSTGKTEARGLPCAWTARTTQQYPNSKKPKQTKMGLGKENKWNKTLRKDIHKNNISIPFTQTVQQNRQISKGKGGLLMAAEGEWPQTCMGFLLGC